MDNIITYVRQTMETFTQLPPNEADSLVLSCAAYLDIPEALPQARSWKGLRLGDLFRAEHFDRLFSVTFAPQRSRELLTALAASPRFRDVRVMGYVTKLDRADEKQFSAMTFRLGDRLSYIAFRGTDSTVVGWKEDFHMAFRSPIPSQQEAVLYLRQAAAHCPGILYLGGHSKGGNLAVYAAAFCDKRLQKRIGLIFSHDGPGFLPQVLESAGFAAVTPRIRKTIPQSSVIGLLLEQQEPARIIKSRTVSILQHDPFTWEVHGHGFVTADHLTAEARHVDRTLSAWLEQMPHDKRERFVDALFGILETTDIHTFDQLRTDWQKTVPAVAREAIHLDTDTRSFLVRTLRELAALSLKALPETVRQSARSKREH